MSIGLISLLIMLSLFAALLAGLPVFFSLFGVAMVFTLIFLGPPGLFLAFTTTFVTVLKEIYIAVPLFIFMAVVLEVSGIGGALYDTMYKWMGPINGGLAVGTVLASTIIAAMTGIGGTAVVIMGLLALPEMLKRGYDKSLVLGSIPAGGALGPLIPPSILMVIIGGFGSLSVGRLFLGGLFPGLLMSFLFCMYILIRAFLKPELAPAIPPQERATWQQKFSSLTAVILPIFVIFAVLGTIYLGIATPTEAAGLGAMGAIISAAVYRNLNWQNLRKALMTSFRINAMVMSLIIGGTALASILTAVGASKFIGGIISGLPVAPTVIIIIMLIIGLVLGMFMDGAAVVMISIPIFFPVISSLGVDLLWFAVLYTICMIIGYISPPFGMNLFYLKGLAPKDVSMMDIYRASLPFVAIGIITMFAALAFPGMITWLPSLMK